jgi:hypothetical protein
MWRSCKSALYATARRVAPPGETPDQRLCSKTPIPRGRVQAPSHRDKPRVRAREPVEHRLRTPRASGCTRDIRDHETGSFSRRDPIERVAEAGALGTPPVDSVPLVDVDVDVDVDEDKDEDEAEPLAFGDDRLCLLAQVG